MSKPVERISGELNAEAEKTLADLDKCKIIYEQAERIKIRLEDWGKPTASIDVVLAELESYAEDIAKRFKRYVKPSKGDNNGG